MPPRPSGLSVLAIGSTSSATHVSKTSSKLKKAPATATLFSGSRALVSSSHLLDLVRKVVRLKSRYIWEYEYSPILGVCQSRDNQYYLVAKCCRVRLHCRRSRAIIDYHGRRQEAQVYFIWEVTIARFVTWLHRLTFRSLIY